MLFICIQVLPCGVWALVEGHLYRNIWFGNVRVASDKSSVMVTRVTPAGVVCWDLTQGERPCLSLHGLLFI